VRRGRAPARRADTDADLADEVGDELAEQLRKGLPAARRERATRRLQDAARVFGAERYGDAARMLKPLAEEAPGVAAVRELYGLTLYRQGKWRLAARELEAFRLLTGSTEQNPVLADCYRALRQWGKVDELWEELRATSPGAELVTEGRIVVAGALADRGDLAGGIRVLSRDWRFPKRVEEHHLRRAYALADLYERAGDVPQARDLFSRVRAADPDFGDVTGRLRSLR
jgi:tetratricopeptide (TPR) repeat protein